MGRFCLKHLIYLAITAVLFVNFANLEIVQKKPVISFLVLFAFVFFCIKVIPSVFMLVFKILVFAVISIGTTYLLGLKYDLKLPFLSSPSVKQEKNSPEYTVSGIPKEITDNFLFKIENELIKLYGISLPKEDGECVDDNGTKKSCQKEAKKAFLDKVTEKEISCISKEETNEFKLATCTLNNEDIVSYLIKNGFGLADSKKTHTYDKDEKEAQKNQRGIWKNMKKNDFLKDLKEKWNNLF